VGKAAENGGLWRSFRRRSRTPFRAFLPPPLTYSRGNMPKSTSTWPHHPQFCRVSSLVLKTASHLLFCSLKKGSLRNLVPSRVLFKDRVLPLSVRRWLSAAVTILHCSASRCACPRRLPYHLAVAYISLAPCAISSSPILQACDSQKVDFPSQYRFITVG